MTQGMRIDRYCASLEHKLASASSLSLAGKYATIRSLIQDLSDADAMSTCCDYNLLVRCRKALKRSNSQSVNLPVQQIKRQCLNLRRMMKSIRDIKNPTIRFEILSLKWTSIATGEVYFFRLSNLPNTDRYRLQIERERQANTGWKDELQFLQHIFACLPGSEVSVVLRELATGVIWEKRKGMGNECWLWGLFLRSDIGVAERVTALIYDGGSGIVTLNATIVPDTPEGGRLHSSIHNALIASSKYIRDLTKHTLPNTLNLDIMLRISDQFKTMGFQGASLGLPLAVMFVGHYLKAPMPARTALTGEIDSEGNVYTVGGIPQKIEAAISIGVERIFVPAPYPPRSIEETRNEVEIVPTRSLAESCDQLFQETLTDRGLRAFPLAASSLSAEPIRPTSTYRNAPLVGRESHIQWLKQRVNRAISGRGNLSFLSGEPGAGKSRLLARALGYASEMGMYILKGRCIHHRVSVPFLPILDPLLNATGPVASLLSTAKCVDYLSGLRTLMTLGEHNADDSASVRQLQIFEQITLLLRELIKGPGLFVSIEDAQWCDSGTIELVEYLARHLNNSTVCVVISYRTQESISGDSTECFIEKMNQLLSEELAERLEIENLTLADTRKLVEYQLNQCTAPASFVERIYGASAGNPLFINELVQWWHEEDYSSDDLAELYGVEEGALPIPPRIYDLVLTRIGRLERTEREVLEIAAVCGEMFDFEHMLSMVEYPRIKVLRSIQTLEREFGLIRPIDGTRYQFSHGTIQEVVYSEMLPSLRREYHSAWSSVFLSETPDEVQPETIAHHLTNSGENERAVPYLRVAAKRSASMTMYREAKRLWETLDRIIAREADTSSPRIEIDLALGRLYATMGDIKQAELRLARAENSAAVIGNGRLRADALSAIGATHRNRGKWVAAMGSFRKALALYNKVGHAKGIAQVRNYLGTIAYLRGRWKEAHANYQEARLIFTQINMKNEISSVNSNLGGLAFYRGENEAAMGYFIESLEGHQITHNTLGIAQVNANIGLLYERIGNMAEALSYCQRSVTTFERIGSYRQLVVAYANLARISAKSGRLQHAEELCLRAKELSKRFDYRLGLSEITRIHGLVLTAKKEWRNACNEFKTAVKLSTEAGDPVGIAESMIFEGEMYIELGNRTAALESLRKALGIYRKVGAKGEIVSAKELIARANALSSE